MAHWKNVAISVNFWAISEIFTDLRPASDSGSDKHLKTSVASIFSSRTISSNFYSTDIYLLWQTYILYFSSFRIQILYDNHISKLLLLKINDQQSRQSGIKFFSPNLKCDSKSMINIWKYIRLIGKIIVNLVFNKKFHFLCQSINVIYNR